MRSSKLIEMLLPGLACLAFVFVAGTAFAGKGEENEVPDNFWDIDGDTENANADGFITCDSSQFDGEACARCDNGTDVCIQINHPDDVKARKGKCTVGQSQKTNEATVFVDRRNTEAGTLNCDKAQVEVSVKTKGDDSGKFEGKAKNCPGGFLSESEIEQVADDCADNKAIKGKIDGDTIKNLQIKGKGEAFID